MKKNQKENIDKVNKVKNKVLNFYPFVEVEKEKSLICELSSSKQLIFKLFYNVGTVDLVMKEAISDFEKEKSIVLSFSFENEEDKRKLNELLKIREK